jgi:hypothetical protein
MMGKILSIVAACAIVASGVVFGLYSYSGMSHRQCDRADLAACEVAAEGGCCSDSAACESNPAMAVAGPAALLGLSPVKAEVASCCAAPTKIAAKPACCCEEAAAPTSLVAVTGAAATVAAK